MKTSPHLYIGLMSGTSMDAVDAALVDLSEKSPRLIATHSNLIDDQLRNDLTALCMPGLNEIHRLGELDVKIGKLFAQTANDLLNKTTISPKQIRAIGSHGQTIRHMPNAKHPFTLQIGDPNIIAEQTGITTVADFRRRDMAKGGQGAPLSPAFHNAIFRTTKEDRIILNLGGIANITWLPAGNNLPIMGFDTGPANTLLDAWINKHLQKNYDKNGEWSANGKINNELLENCLADPYFTLSPPKSTGREYFNLDWLTAILEKNKKNISSQDIQATLCELTAKSIVKAIYSLNLTSGKILVCGGGVKNNFLIHRLQQQANNFSIHSTEEFGVPPEWLEAMAFAWLAKQTMEMKSGNLPNVTGAKDFTMLGGVYY